MSRLCIAGVLAAGILAAQTQTSKITFNKDVLPILQAKCQECHRPGEVAPMSLLTYQDARPWAKAIKAAVKTEKMPPWFLDIKYEGHFTNSRRLSQEETNTLSAWADSGALEGDAKDKPAPRLFVEGWNLKPDLVIEMPTAFQVPATGTVEYQYMRVKGNFPEDLWIEAAEMRPENSGAVHHGEVWVIPPGSKWMERAEYGVSYPMSKMPKVPSDDADIIGKYNPGVGAQNFNFGDSAKFIPKGSDIVFEIHYTTNGKAVSEKTKVGLVFAKGLHNTRYFTSYGPTASNLVIPAGDRNAEVVGEVTVTSPTLLVYAQPHMHLRGKDYELRAIYPTGETETFFKAKFDFNWQLGYYFDKPVVLPVGTRLLGISHFDNSPNNPFNPDPSKEVIWGLQNWEEMSNCFLGLVFDAKVDPKKVFKRSGYSTLKRLPGQAGPSLDMLSASLSER
ncbi:MAG TPA: thiol-disulfide isomerase [Candidatus Angelobacter sp.]|nr:thiol-disulfide isomerase [Candidatus Angelobacter sp.]